MILVSSIKHHKEKYYGRKYTEKKIHDKKKVHKNATDWE